MWWVGLFFGSFVRSFVLRSQKNEKEGKLREEDEGGAVAGEE